jgi:serine/threonine-protein kinase
MDIKKIKNYEIDLNPVGKGNYSEVFLAKDLNQQSTVAIKVSSCIDMSKYEATVIKSYGSHPLFPKFYDFFIIEDKAYIVMEYFPGKGIGHWNYHSTIDIGRKNEQEAISITLKVLQGLEHLHQIGFAHHDLLPKNILFRDEIPAKIKIIDFGLAKELNYEKNHKYKVGDISAAATLCIYLINGVVSKIPLDDLKTISSDLREVLSKAFEPNLEKRYQSATEFIKVIQPLVH